MKIKVMNNVIIVAALVVFLGSGHYASAYVPGVWGPQPRSSTANEPGFVKVPMPSDEPAKTQTTSTQQTSSTSQSTQATQPATTKAVTKAPVKKTTTVASNTYNNNRNLPPVVTTDQTNGTYPNNGSNITALSLQGSGSFMPSSIWQWILVIFLILVIIIIARMISKKPHAHHDPHGHAPHPAH